MRWGRMVGATLLTLCALGCAANPRVSEPAAPLPDSTEQAQGEPGAQASPGQEVLPAGTRIESITAQPEATGTVITIRGDHPLSYTSYDPDATRLVLELPNADASSLQSIIEVGTAQGLTNVRSVTTSATSVTIDDLPNGVYYIRVRSQNSAGLSAPSNEVAVQIKKRSPAASPGE